MERSLPGRGILLLSLPFNLILISCSPRDPPGDLAELPLAWPLCVAFPSGLGRMFSVLIFPTALFTGGSVFPVGLTSSTL